MLLGIRMELQTQLLLINLKFHYEEAGSTKFSLFVMNYIFPVHSKINTDFFCLYLVLQSSLQF